MTAFFIPGLEPGLGTIEDVYTEMRRCVELDTGIRPSGRRIMQIWSRRGGIDCLTEVGVPDPIHGGTVLAIFDLGPHQPFVVNRQDRTGPPNGISEVLSAHAYTVTEFES